MLSICTYVWLLISYIPCYLSNVPEIHVDKKFFIFDGDKGEWSKKKAINLLTQTSIFEGQWSQKWYIRADQKMYAS